MHLINNIDESEIDLDLMKIELIINMFVLGFDMIQRDMKAKTFAETLQN